MGRKMLGKIRLWENNPNQLRSEYEKVILEQALYLNLL